MRAITVALLIMLALLSRPADAFLGGADGDRYYVIKASSIELDADDSNNATSLAFAFGQYLGDRRVAASETELGITLSSGDTADGGLFGSGSRADWELLHLGSFVSFQSLGTVRIKGKLGFAFTQLDVGNRTEQDFGAGAGVAGIFGPVEVELTQLGSDFTQFSVGFRF